MFAYMDIYVHKIPFTIDKLYVNLKLGITILILSLLPFFEMVISKNRFWCMKVHMVYLGNKNVLKYQLFVNFINLFCFVIFALFTFLVKVLECGQNTYI